METEKERRPVLTTADACPRCKPLVDALNNEILMLEEKLERLQASIKMVEAPRQAGDFEITPEMIASGRAVLEKWLAEWDYLEGGSPGEAACDALIRSILASTRFAKPAASITAKNLREYSSRLMAAACKSSGV